MSKRVRLRPAAAVALACLAVLPSCGGSSEGFVDIQVPVFLDESVSGSISDGGTVLLDQSLLVGDSALRISWRGFYTFPLPETNPGFRVERAMLMFNLEEIGGAPFAELGAEGLTVSAVNAGPFLDAADYNALLFLPNGVLSATMVSDGQVGSQSLDVTEIVRAIQEAGFEQLTLRFAFQVATNSDPVSDFVRLTKEGPPATMLLLDYEPE